MKQDYSIEVKNVSKIFRKNLKSFRSMAGYLFKRNSPDNFYALDDISFSLKPGDTLGIIGKNGSGKSTLLKVIANITKSSSGTLKVKGKIASLIELGAGFHQELTGRENIFLYGAILGMSKKEINENFDRIVEFAELQDWLETPIKFYSSGMFVRLGFAIVAHSDSDILLIDEAIAVGDEQFQQKCFKKIEEFKKDKKIIVLVSHSHEVISQHTERAIWLDHGKVMADGKSEEVINAYMYKMLEEENNATNSELEDKTSNQKINKIAEITKIEFWDKDDKPKNVFETGDDISIRVYFKINKNEPVFNFGLALFNQESQYIFGINTIIDKINTKKYLECKYFQVNYTNLPIKTNFYYVKAGIFGETDKKIFDFMDKPSIFKIISKNRNQGLVELSYKWE
ncbi:MAG: ABC transporter ATP-binding protein [Candidatus Nomurabacteria bacterium]|nr:ABC transporter ATP-binding protein [Candidatus Nomurabacteria bacterium]